MADLPFQIIVDDDGSVVVKRFGDTVAQTGKRTVTTAARMTTAFKGLGGRLRRLPGSIFNIRNAIIGLGAAGVLRGIIRAGDEVERARARLVGLRGGIEGANEAFSFFQEVASGVAFSLRDVITAGIQIEAFGAKSEETLEAVTDLAAFMGTDLPTAASAFGRAFAAGAGAADILRERGVLTLVSLRTGIQDLTKLTLPEFRKALLSAFVDTAGPIAGSAERLGDTFTGQLSFAADAVFKLQQAFAEAGFLDLAKELISNFTEFANVMLDLTKQNTPAIQEFVESLRAFIPTTETMIKGAFLAARAFEGLRFIFLQVQRALTAMAGTLLLVTGQFRRARMLRREFAALGEEVEKVEIRMFRLVRAQEKLLKGIRDTAAARKEFSFETDKEFQKALAASNAIRAEEKAVDDIVKGRARRAELSAAALENLATVGIGTVKQLESAVGVALSRETNLFEANAIQVSQVAETILRKNLEVQGRQAVELRTTNEASVRAIAKTSEETVAAIVSTLQGVRKAEQVAILADLEAFKGSEDQKKEFVRNRVAAEIQLEREAKLDASAQLLSGLAALAETEGNRLFEVTKALRLGEALVNTFAAANAILADPALTGRPFLRFTLAAAAVAQGLANVQRIRAAKPGGGAGGGGGGAPGGGGGGGGAPAGGAPEQQAGIGQRVAVTVNMAGFIGDEAALASEIARIQREAGGDDVETFLSP